MGRRSSSPRRTRSPRRSRPRSRSSSFSKRFSRSRSRPTRRLRSRSFDRRKDRNTRNSERRGRSRSLSRAASRREPLSLLVRNLSPETTPDELRRAFSRSPGDILDVYIPKEFNSNRPRGFAFIEFADSRIGRDVKFEMDRSTLSGREIAVLFAKQNRKSPHEMRRILNAPADEEESPRHSSRRRSKSHSRSSLRKRRSSSLEDKQESTSPRASPSPRRASPSPSPRRASPSPKRKSDETNASRSPSADAMADDTMSE